MKERMPQQTEVYLTRHSTKAKQEESEYKQLSLSGVERAQERAKDLTEAVEQSDDGTIFFLGGNSIEDRTKSTLEVYSDELKRNFQDNEDVLFFGRDKIKDMSKDGYSSTAESLIEEIQQSPESKVIIDLPLYIKDIMKKESWYESTGEVKKGQLELLEKHGKDYTGAIKEWFKQVNNKQGSINPKEIAENYLNGIKRLEEFIKKFAPDRKINIVMIGHSFEIDALLTYLANDGKIDAEGFEKIGGKVVDETELSTIELKNEGQINLNYRGNDFVFKSQK